MVEELGRMFMFVGSILFTMGLIIVIGSKLKAGIPFGKLPGDIYIKRDGFVFYFPLTTGIIFSIILSLCLMVIVNLFWKGK